MLLRPFGRAELSTVAPWFEDSETRRWLGGTDWPSQMLELASRPLGEFRGARELGRWQWLGWSGEAAVGYIDARAYDRWTTWDEVRGVVSAIPIPSAGVAFVVAPMEGPE